MKETTALLSLLLLVARPHSGFSFDLFSGSNKVPTNANSRNRQAIASIQRAVQNPKTPSFKLIECEFPVLDNLNKLGDGSLASSMQADAANLQFCSSLCVALQGLPLVGNFCWLLTSASATNRFYQAASKKVSNLHSLKNGLPNLKSRDICVLACPSSATDYQLAEQMALNGNTVVVVNGFAKTQKSISQDATMAYFLKPLTYNSQIGGYLMRCYPGLWTTLDGSGKVLGTSIDEDILVPHTNTPDLRGSVRLVQTAVDKVAIRNRQVTKKS